MKIRHVIPMRTPDSMDLNRQHKDLVITEIMNLPSDVPWLVQAEPYRKKRSIDQNSFLHGVPLKLIHQHTGTDIEDIKDYLLGECFGWLEYEVFDNRRRKPAKRSSELNTVEFGSFLDFIERWASEELGMIIPKPNEIIT